MAFENYPIIQNAVNQCNQLIETAEQINTEASLQTLAQPLIIVLAEDTAANNYSIDEHFELYTLYELVAAQCFKTNKYEDTYRFIEKMALHILPIQEYLNKSTLKNMMDSFMFSVNACLENQEQLTQPINSDIFIRAISVLVTFRAVLASEPDALLQNHYMQTMSTYTQAILFLSEQTMGEDFGRAYYEDVLNASFDTILGFSHDGDSPTINEYSDSRTELENAVDELFSDSDMSFQL